MSTQIRAIYEHGSFRLLDPVDLTEGEKVNLSIERATLQNDQPGNRLSARDILKLPLAEQDRLLEEAAVKTEMYYRNDPDLTDFEAFGDKDFFDETP
jgi:predicted DNA-binding antitoxin AbrB/MazE fold protein